MLPRAIDAVSHLDEEAIEGPSSFELLLRFSSSMVLGIADGRVASSRRAQIAKKIPVLLYPPDFSLSIGQT